MAEIQANQTQYEYAQNSNLVLQSETTGPRNDEPTGEPETLAGKIGHKFGGLAQREKPLHILQKHELKLKKKLHKAAGEILDPKKRTEITVERTSHILNTHIAEGLLYRPKTKETRVVYEQFLNIIQRFTGDHSQEILKGAVDEVLAILKTDGITDMERKKEIEALFLDPVTDDTFNKLRILGKQLIDYDPDDDERMEEDEIEQPVDFDLEKEMSDQELEHNLIVDEDDDEDREIMTEEEKNIRALHHNAEEGQQDMESVHELSVSAIDAFWLQRQLRVFFDDANIVLEKEKQIINILKIEQLRECENKLVMVLDYERFHFIKLLLQNRSKILFLTRLGQAQSKDEREKIIQEMKLSEEGSFILKQLESIKDKKDTAKEYAKKVRHEASTLKKVEEVQMAEEKEKLENEVDIQAMQHMDIDEDLMGAQKKLLDLESLTFNQGAHFMSNQKCFLPKESSRVSCKGYEEIVVPAVKQKRSKLEKEKRIPITDLPSWMQTVFTSVKATSLNIIQSKVYEAAFKSAQNLLICAPTGAGKTNIALLTILHQIALHREKEKKKQMRKKSFKVIYIAPMKALVTETVGNFSRRLNTLGITVKELTGDVHLTKEEIDNTDIIVTTPEKWDIITRKGGERTFLNKVRLIIIDEIHLLHDMRGPVLESIVARTIRMIENTQQLIRIVALSATLPNFEDVAAFLRVSMDKGLFYFDSSYRPVPLEQIYVGVTERKAIKRLMLMNEILYEKILERAGKHQILVFVHSRKETVRTAKMIRDMALAKNELSKFLKEGSASREILQIESEQVTNVDLKELLPYGIAIHHAGLNRTDRDTVEDLFGDFHIHLLVSTATLAWGVNLPAHTVIIKGTQIYSPEKGKWVELSPQDILQMMGRAGRPQYDIKGEGILITSHSELQYYLSLNNQQLPIESQLLSQLPDMLNAEIVLGTITNSKDAIIWLGYTYLFIRMLKAPQIYGLSKEMLELDPYLFKFRAELVHTALTMLDKSNLIKYDKKTGLFQVTALGRVASHYYIKHNSMAVYNEHLKPTMGIIELFRLFSLSKEFEFIPIREEEKLELQKFAEIVPIPIKGSLEESASKITILLQAYISRYKLDGYALNSDMVYVTQSAGRITRAIFEICLKRGWAQVAYLALQLSKMIDKKMWSISIPLRQFRGIPEDILTKLEKKEQFTWEHYYDMTPQQIGEIIKFPDMGVGIHRQIHQFPKVELAAYVQPITRSCVRVELTVTPDFNWEPKLHGSSEPFWIIVEDVDSEIILHYEQLLLKQKYGDMEYIITFTVPLFSPIPPQYFIKVISDRWLSSEAVLPISFRHLILPAKFPAHTELLDLQPLPIEIFEWPEAQQLFSEFKQFNPIQTQVFGAVYNSDDNILIGAPSSSGKTAIAEFAILRNIKKQDEGKWIYIAPVNALVDIRYRQWVKKFKPFGITVGKLIGQTLKDLKILDASNLIVASPEHWDHLSRRWKQRKNVQKVSLFIVDEAHLIGQAGSVLEVIISRIRYIVSQIEKPIRIVALSTSIGNSKDIADWIGVRPNNLYNFHPHVRPVSLEIHIQGIDQNERESRILGMVRPAFESVVIHSPQKPAIIFAPDRPQTSLLALSFISYAAMNPQMKKLKNPGTFLGDISSTKKEFNQTLKQISDDTLRYSCGFGVGFIHIGISAADKRIVRNLWNMGWILVIVAQYNLCWELDELRCSLVGVVDAEKYDWHEKRYVEYSIPDMLQMMGRAGRVKDDESGKFILLCHSSKKEYFKKFLYESFPIESHLDHFLHDHLNAEIIAETIENKHDAIDWITWTFLYRRLTQNPNYYNLQGVSGEYINDFLSELIENTIEDLDKAKCITVEEEVELIPANLGRVAAYYYISYNSMHLLSESLSPSRRLRALIEILASCHEFQDIPSRPGEEPILRALLPQIKYAPSDLKADPISRTLPYHIKINILIQAHLSRIAIPGDLQVDLEKTLGILHNLIPALVDVVSSLGNLKLCILAMELSQMIIQGMWISESQLYQLPHFNADIISELKEMEIEDIDGFINMEDDERKKILDKYFTNKDQEQIAVVCNRYPSVEMNYHLESNEVGEGETIVVDIEVERDIEENVIPPVWAPYFPKEKDENWWIFIGNEKDDKLLSIKRLLIPKSSKSQLKFTLANPGNYNLKLYLVCDSYIGSDQEEKVSVKVYKSNDQE